MANRSEGGSGGPQILNPQMVPRPQTHTASPYPQRHSLVSKLSLKLRRSILSQLMCASHDAEMHQASEPMQTTWAKTALQGKADPINQHKREGRRVRSGALKAAMACGWNVVSSEGRTCCRGIPLGGSTVDTYIGAGFIR
ncbi:hypothetical protein ACEQ8H_004247 [Pleosporales sp. CAS-2024a]